MTTEEIRLVRSSFARVEPIAAVVARTFYARLFAIAPATRALFPVSMEVQGGKLMAMLGTVVASLDRLDALVPVAEDLARRHVDYGVRAAHYASVGHALLETLATGLGDDFDAKTRSAWTTAYGTLSSVMIAAARPGAAR